MRAEAYLSPPIVRDAMGLDYSVQYGIIYIRVANGRRGTSTATESSPAGKDNG